MNQMGNNRGASGTGHKRTSPSKQPPRDPLFQNTSSDRHQGQRLGNVAAALQRAGTMLGDFVRELTTNDVDSLAQEVFKGQWEAERIMRWLDLLADDCKATTEKHRVRIQRSILFPDLDGGAGKRKRA